jgi:hypothetical protein
MVFIVEMARQHEPEGDPPECFDCHVRMWEYLLSLGQSYGWVPAGAVTLVLDPKLSGHLMFLARKVLPSPNANRKIAAMSVHRVGKGLTNRA